MKTCGICGGPLDVEGMPCTLNCGGDCELCMAEFGDPDCARSLQRPPTQAEEEFMLSWGVPVYGPAPRDNWLACMRAAMGAWGRHCYKERRYANVR